MSLSADKKNGKLTGRFRVEVQLRGKRLRGRFSTIEEARKMEAEWKVQLARTDDAGATERQGVHCNPRTLEELVNVAAPILWEGSAHGEDALAKLAKIMEVVGPDKRLFELSTTDVGKVIVCLRELGKAPGTINRYLSAFHRVLAWGNTKGRDYVAVLPRFEWQDEDEGRIFIISRAQEAEMLRYLRGWGRDDIADFIQAALDTGCRRRELPQCAARPAQWRLAHVVDRPNPDHDRTFSASYPPRKEPLTVPLAVGLYCSAASLLVRQGQGSDGLGRRGCLRDLRLPPHMRDQAGRGGSELKGHSALARAQEPCDDRALCQVR